MGGRTTCSVGILCCLILSGVGFLSTPTDAETDIGWGLPVLVEDCPGIAYAPEVAVDGAGNAIVVWYQDDAPYGDNYNNIWASRYAVGVGWGPSELLETDDSGSASSPKVVMDSDGNAVAVWFQSNGSGYSVWSNRYVVGSGWGLCEAIETSDDSVYFPRLAGNDQGDAVAAWFQFNDDNCSIWANRYSPGIGWGSAEQIPFIESGNDTSPGIPEVVVDGTGNATAVWQQWDGTRRNLWASRWSASTGWGNPELIETLDDGDIIFHNVAIDDDGNVAVVWESQKGVDSDIWANRFAVGLGWDDATLIENSTEPAYDPEVDMDAFGNAVAVWNQDTGYEGRTSIWANRHVADTGWEGPVLVDEDEVNTAYSPESRVKIAVDDDGNAVTVRHQYDGDRFKVTANRYAVDLGWSAAHVIDTPETSGSDPNLVIDRFGSVIVIWQHYNITTNEQDIWASYNDVTPPPLLIASPEDDDVLDAYVTTVAGVTEPGARMVINGLIVEVEPDGSFSVEILLFEGLNTIEAAATDSVGNPSTVTLNVTFIDPRAGIEDKLNETEAELTVAQDEMQNLMDALAAAADELSSLRDDLNSTLDEIESVHEDVEHANAMSFLLGGVAVAFGVLALAVIVAYTLLKKKTGTGENGTVGEERPP